MISLRLNCGNMLETVSTCVDVKRYRGAPLPDADVDVPDCDEDEGEKKYR